MQIISQVRLSTFDGGKTFNGEIKIGDVFVNLTADALRTLLAEHKRLGGTVRRFQPRSVVIKNAERAARYGRKAGEAITVTDYATDRMRFDITIGVSIAFRLLKRLVAGLTNEEYDSAVKESQLPFGC